MKKMKKIKRINKQKGLSLIELLISMLIGAIVLLGVYKIFDFTKKSNQTLQAEAEMQENARFAFSIMTSIVQEAGFFGCQASSVVTKKSLVKSSSNTFRPERIIEGWEASNTQYGSVYTANINSAVVNTETSNWTTSDGAQMDPNTLAKESSDLFKVWYVKKQKGILSSASSDVLAFSAIDLEVGDIISINDCQTVTLAQVCACEDNDCAGMDTSANIATTACASPGNNTFNPTSLNIATTEINILDAALFFIGKRGDNASNPPSLFVRHLGNDATLNTKEEVLEGVESMQVLYGEDTNGDKSANAYVSANNVAKWSNVVSLKISLLLRSSRNNITQGTQSINFNGAPVTIASTDHHLRRVFTSTISLRNRN